MFCLKLNILSNGWHWELQAACPKIKSITNDIKKLHISSLSRQPVLIKRHSSRHSASTMAKILLYGVIICGKETHSRGRSHNTGAPANWCRKPMSAGEQKY
jgi:hypothetical protein